MGRTLKREGKRLGPKKKGRGGKGLPGWLWGTKALKTGGKLKGGKVKRK